MKLLSPAPDKAPMDMAPRRRSTLILIGAFWLLAFLVLSLRGALVDSFPFSDVAPRRLIAAGFGAGQCLLMIYLLGRVRSRAFAAQIASGLLLALAASVVHSLFVTLVNRILFPLKYDAPLDWLDVAQWMMVWFGYYLAWTAAHLAMTYNWDAEDRRGQAAILHDLAQEARIAALRYQINPHFLFNALNAISALVGEGRNEDAEAMLLHLSTFLRSTLSEETGGEVDLRGEIALQRMYLAVEQIRFPDRMRVEVDLPMALADTAVPALILQPLIENAVRYGVGRSEQLTTIRIGGALRAGQVVLSVENDGPSDAAGRPGTGLGLANVRARLQAHYGPQAVLEAGPRDGGGFLAAMTFPWRRRACQG